MLLTIRDLPDDFVQRVKRATGCATGSKAFVEAAHLYLLQLDKIKRLEAEVESMKLQVKSYQQTLAAARDAAIQLAEVASQGDFFQAPESTPARLKHLVHGDSKVAAHLERLQGKS